MHAHALCEHFQNFSFTIACTTLTHKKMSRENDNELCENSRCLGSNELKYVDVMTILHTQKCFREFEVAFLHLPLIRLHNFIIKL